MSWNGVTLHRPSWRTLLDSLPVAIAVILLFSPYLPFVVWVAFEETYQKRGLVLRFSIQIIAYHLLLLLTLLSLFTASLRAPGSPSPEFIHSTGRDQYSLQEESDFRGTGGGGDDDIPLSQLMVPRQEGRMGHRELEVPDDGEGGEFDIRGFLSQGPPVGHDEGFGGGMGGKLTITSKSTTGGQRWCRKCNSPKPDRCHHCRQCGRCILKMDHHCIWLNNCIGYNNHKPFLLFLFYSFLYSLFCAEEGVWVVYRFFHDEGGDEDIIDFKPVAYLLISMAGTIFSISIGSFLGFHTWLTTNNITTLENMSASIPSATLTLPTPSPSSIPPPAYSSRHRPSLEFRRPGDRWKADHEMSRDERRKGKRMGRELNVYDLGWRRNLEAVFEVEEEGGEGEEGEGLLPGERREGRGRARVRRGWRDVGLWFWPLTQRRRTPLAGHTFPHSAQALEELKKRTAEIRLGLNDYEVPSED